MSQIHNEYFPIKSDLNPKGNHAPFWERILPNPSEESHVPLVAKTLKDMYKLKLPNNTIYLTTQKKKNLSAAPEGSELKLPDFAITHLKKP